MTDSPDSHLGVHRRSRRPPLSSARLTVRRSAAGAFAARAGRHVRAGREPQLAVGHDFFARPRALRDRRSRRPAAARR